MKRILIVNSSVERCLALSDFLNDQGFETGVADNGLRALGMLAECDPLPDFILLDVSLASSNNWGLRDMLKTHKRYSDIPVILMGEDGVGEEIDLGSDLSALAFSGVFAVARE